MSSLALFASSLPILAFLEDCRDRFFNSEVVDVVVVSPPPDEASVDVVMVTGYTSVPLPLSLSTTSTTIPIFLSSAFLISFL